MNDIVITAVGNVASEPTSRDLPSGAKVVDFRLASTPRYREGGSGEWKDGETTFMTVSCFRALTETVMRSVHRGDPVVVQGRLSLHTYENAQGEKRMKLQVDATTVGHDLSKGNATFSRTPRRPEPFEPRRGDESGQGDEGGFEPEQEPQTTGVAA